MKRLQVYLPEDLLENLRLYAQSQGIPLAEAIREAGKEFSHKPTVKKEIKIMKRKRKTYEKDPILAMAGMLGAGPTDASMTVDDIYDD